MAMPLHKNPCPWGHGIYNFGRSFLCHHYYTFSLYGPCTRIEKIFKEIHQFNNFYPKITSPWGGGGSGNLQFLVSLPYRCYIPNFF